MRGRVASASVAGYNRQSFDVAYSFGEEAEVLVEHIFDNLETVEVKRKSRNDSVFYIEVWARQGRDWVPSGLSKSEAHTYALVSPTLHWEVFVETDVLKEAVRRKASRVKPIANIGTATQPTKGYLLTFDEIVEADT